MFTFLSTKLETRRCTGRSNAQGPTHYSKSKLSPLLCLSTRATCAMVHASRFSPNQCQCMWPKTPAVKPSWGALYNPKIDLQIDLRPLRWTESGFLAGACRLLRTGCTGLFRPPVRPVRTHLHPLCTPKVSPFPHQRLSWCIGGSSIPWSEFVCGHGSSPLTKRGSKQHTHCPKPTKITKMSSAWHANPECCK